MPDQSSAATEHAIFQEITQPLESLPEDPLALLNADFPVALRGYERVAVDEYVRHTRRLVAELHATRSPEAAVRRALERVGEQIAGVLQRAHDTAGQITAQSRSEAEDRLEQARAEARQIAQAAERRVRDLDVDTDRIWMERQRIVADAQDLAAQLLALTKTAAERFPADEEIGEVAEAEPSLDQTTDTTPGPDATVAYEDAPPTEAMAVHQPLTDVDEASGEEARDAAWDEPSDDDEDPDAAEPERSPTASDRRDQSEIERTVAYHPLTPTTPDEAVEPDRALPGREPPGHEPPRSSSPSERRSSSIIPPGTEAAHRRFWR
jgi:hypothetical protein